MISGSEGDRSEAAKTAYSRGSQVLHTAIAGAVHVRVAAGKISVDCWHADER